MAFGLKWLQVVAYNLRYDEIKYQKKKIKIDFHNSLFDNVILSHRPLASFAARVYFLFFFFIFFNKIEKQSDFNHLILLFFFGDFQNGYGIIFFSVSLNSFGS